MAQQFNVGTVLGGRYRVTERVLISNDDDHVLRGFDQVLDRPVSILVAAPVNAAQAATSAREIATGERIGNVQILDLGLSDGRTYLITNIAESEDLLDLVIETQKNVPYIEPFMTDTLGSEIFGEARAYEPHVLDDDDEYYHELAQQENRPVNPGFQQRLNDIKSRFGRSKDTENDDAAQESARPAVEEYSPKPEKPASSASRGASGSSAKVAGSAGAAGEATAPRRGTRFSTPPPRPEHQPKVTQLPAEDPFEGTRISEARSGSVAAAAAGAASASSPANDVTPVDETPEFLSDDSSEYWDDQRATNDYEQPAGYYDDVDDEEVDHDKEARRRRLIIGGLLGLVLIVAVVFAFQALIPRGNSTASNSGAANSSAPSAAATSGDASQSPSANAVPAEIVGVTRDVPGNQKLNSDRDNLLPRAIDGKEGTMYRTFSFSSAKFGGFANAMALVVELKDSSDVSEVELTGLNGTGGAFSVLVGETDKLSAATEVAQGSFTGPTVPVSSDQGGPVKAKYVFINITELPRQAAPSSPDRPYGLQIAEIHVK